MRFVELEADHTVLMLYVTFNSLYEIQVARVSTFQQKVAEAFNSLYEIPVELKLLNRVEKIFFQFSL